MRALQLWWIVALMGVVAPGDGRSHGEEPTHSLISDDKATAQRDAAGEKPAARTLTIHRTDPEPPPAIAPFDAEQARKHQQAWAKHLGLPCEWTNSIGMKFVLIPPGEFMMGAPDLEEYRQSNWIPQHRVRITRPFYVGVQEVTQEQYELTTGSNPSRFKGRPQHPVERLTWYHAVEICTKLSALPQEKCPGRVYRLLTEAEWEYACRAGTTTRYSFGDNESALGDYAWYSANALGRTHAVGQKHPNAWGLYDMHGNVWEWCQDWSGPYPVDMVTDPQGPADRSWRVSRGGGWWHGAKLCQSATRFGTPPGAWASDGGVRLALSPSGE